MDNDQVPRNYVSLWRKPLAPKLQGEHSHSSKLCSVSAFKDVPETRIAQTTGKKAREKPKMKEK